MRIILNILIHVCKLLIIIGLYSCSTKKDTKNYKIFRYNQNGGLSSLDPAFAKNQPNIWVVNQLYNGLVELNSNLKITPSLAERWQVSDDGKEYIFYLKKGVKFHNNEIFENSLGREVTAHDFVFSFKRIIDSSTASPGAWIFNDKVKRNLNGSIADSCFYALDNYTFVIKLEKAFPAFLQMLAMPYAYVVPKEAIDKYGKDFRVHPVGTGPFVFKLWDEGNALILNKNQNYWKKDSSGNALPYLDIVHLSFLSDRNIAFMTFRQGKLDMISGLDENSRDVIFTYNGSIKKEFSDQFDVQKIKYLNTEFLAFHLDPVNYENKNHPFLNKKVRQALNYSINREQLVQFILNNVGMPGNKGIAPPFLYSNANAIGGYTYNPTKAYELLKESGYLGKKEMNELKLYTISTFPYKEIAEFLQREWAKIGIKIQIEINTVPTHFEMATKGRMPLFRASWLGDYPEPENYLTLFYSKNFSPSGPNRTHFKNSQYDMLYELCLSEQDESKRFELYKKMEEIVLEEAPVIVLWYDEVVRLTQKNVKGLEANAMNNLVLERVDIVK